MPDGRPNPYTPPPQNPNPWHQYGLDPLQRQQGGLKGNFKQASEGLNYYAQKKGKSISQDQWNQIAQATGYKGDDQVSGDMYNKALDYLDQQWGPQNQPQNNQTGGIDPAQGATENAQNQWRQQANIVGVPSQYKQNPMYGAQSALMQRILMNPQTMGQQQQDQLNEAQKESAGRMAKQASAQAGQSMAGRGFGPNSGAQQAMDQQTQGDLMSQILSGRRDTALKAAQINRQDELNALNASQGLLGQEFNQDMGLANLGLNQINQNRNYNLQDLLGRHGIDQDMWNRGFQKDTFNKTFGLDFLKYLQNDRQFGATLGENQRQYNGNMGFNWAQFDQNTQNNFLNMLMNGWLK